VGGASGKQIYQWLQEQKLGIDGLTGAQGDVKKLVDEYNQLADDVQTGVTKLEGMWTGKAAGAAGRGAGPLGTAFRSAAPHLSNAQGSLSDQAESFTTASNAVVQVPDEPSAPDGLDKVGRWFSGGTVFGGGEAVHQMNEDYNGKKASYDAANQKNIDTYNTFSSSTDSHVKALPKDYGTVPQSVGDLSISADSGSGSGPGASGGPAVHGGGSSAGGAADSGRPGGSGGPGYSYGGYGPGGGTSAASSGGGGSAPGSHYGGYRPGGTSAGQRAAGQGAPAGQGTSAANTSGAVPEGAPGSFGGAGGRPGDQASSRRSGSAGGFGPEAGAAIGPMGAGGAMGAGGGDQLRSGRPFGSAGAQMGGGSEAAGSGRGGAGASAGGARSGVGGMAAEEAAMRGGVSGGAAGKAGASGMPMGGARGAKGGEDEEHSSPGYLVSEDNGSEIVGELPMTAPPVIGE
jgi:hypothetical protein